MKTEFTLSNCLLTEMEVVILLDSLVNDDARKRLQFAGKSSSLESITTNITADQTIMAYNVTLNVSWIIIFNLITAINWNLAEAWPKYKAGHRQPN